MKRAFIYARVSTEEQARHGYSIGAQLDYLRKYAADNGYTVVHEYVDEGVSGRKGYKKRPAMKQLMEDLDSVDVILFLKLDRWFRSVKLYYEADDILKAHDVCWIAAQEDYETVTAGGRFKVNIMLSVAQNEAERTSERINFVFDNMREQGKVPAGSAPLGFKFIDHQIVEDPATLPAVVSCFSHFIGSRSVISTVRYLKEEFDIDYSYTGMRHLLSNRRYIGDKGSSPVVDDATFYKTQEILKARSERRCPTPSGHVYLFSGLIFCRECGARLAGHVHKGHAYYQCYNMTSAYGKCSHNRSIREDAVEKWLLDNLTEELSRLSVSTSVVSDPAVDPERIRSRMARLKDLYLDELISKDEYKADLHRLQAELDECTAKIPAASASVADISETLSLYPALTADNKKAFWSRVLTRVEVDRDNHIFLSGVHYN